MPSTRLMNIGLSTVPALSVQSVRVAQSITDHSELMTDGRSRPSGASGAQQGRRV